MFSYIFFTLDSNVANMGIRNIKNTRMWQLSQIIFQKFLFFHSQCRHWCRFTSFFSYHCRRERINIWMCNNENKGERWPRRQTIKEKREKIKEKNEVDLVDFLREKCDDSQLQFVIIDWIRIMSTKMIKKWLEDLVLQYYQAPVDFVFIFISYYFLWNWLYELS